MKGVPGEGKCSKTPENFPRREKESFLTPGYYLTNQIISSHFSLPYSLPSPDPKGPKAASWMQCTLIFVLLVYCFWNWFTILWGSLSRLRRFLYEEKAELWLSSQTTAWTYLPAMWNSYLESGSSSHHWLTQADICGLEISYPHPVLSKLLMRKTNCCCGSKPLSFGGGLLLSNGNQNRLPSPVGMGKALNWNKY